MLKDENIICISSIDWDFIWQGHQEIMSGLAKSGNRVLFIENTGVRIPRIKDTVRLRKRLSDWLSGVRGFREVDKDIFVYSPLFLPFPYSRIARWINRNILSSALRKWIKLMDFRDPIVWTFLPTGTALDLIDSFDYKCLVYYCIADFNKLADQRKIEKTEMALVKKADVVFAQGKSLEEKCRKFNSNVHVFPFGVNIDIFDSSRKIYDQREFADIRNVPRPIIGYVGGIHRHIDFDLLAFAAGREPGMSFVFIGPEQTDISMLKGFKNMYFLGKKEFRLLPGYINEFDVCTIPYLKSEYTETVYPTKLNEYHALGKPVVSTDLPEISVFNRNNGDLVLTSDSKEEFLVNIKLSLEEGCKGRLKERIESARKNSWPFRIKQMCRLIEESIQRSRLAGHQGWQMVFRNLYRSARRRLIKAVSLLVILWFLLFYTPLLWFLAEPLKISEKPRKANAIFVFGGGVGESGVAGQGYEERVDYAVQLFKQGYAGNLIFSTGYRFVFNEAEVMKALAVASGVPESAITVDEKSISTYDNVKLVKEVMAGHEWKSALIVSSPFNMARVRLVFAKIASDVKVIYVPIPKSSFYGLDDTSRKPSLTFRKQAGLRQIKGILHEYISIVYYWLTGKC